MLRVVVCVPKCGSVVRHKEGKGHDFVTGQFHPESISSGVRWRREA
jgi:hypothetical protein